jgi:hypothetical protein
MIEVSVDLQRREIAFRHGLHVVDGELGDGAVGPGDVDSVSRLQILQGIEDSRAELPGIDMAEDDRRTKSTRGG